MTSRDLSQTAERVLAALARVPPGLTVRQIVLALGYADTDEQQVEEALRELRGHWAVESYHRTIPGDVVLVWQHRHFSVAHRILLAQGAA